LWGARVQRYGRARTATLLARQRGATAPDHVVAFFAPPFPEQPYRSGLYLLELVLSVLLLAGGLATIAVGFGQVENWDASWVAVVFGAIMLLPSPVLFYAALQLGTRMPASLVRSHVLARVIAGDLT
jgi:hypothetical protein